MKTIFILTLASTFLGAMHPVKPQACTASIYQRFNTLQKIAHNELQRTPIIQKKISNSTSEFIRTVGYPQMPYPLQRLLYEQRQLEAMNWDCARFENHCSLYNIASLIRVIRDHIHSQHNKHIPSLFFALNPTSSLRELSEFDSERATATVNLCRTECVMELRDFEGVLYPYRFINKSAHNLRDDIEFSRINTIEHIEETLTLIKQIQNSRCSDNLIKTIFNAMSALNIYCIRGLYIPHHVGYIVRANGKHENDLEKIYTDYCKKTDNLELPNFLSDAYIQDARHLYEHKDVHLKYYIPAPLKNKINEILTDHGIDTLD